MSSDKEVKEAISAFFNNPTGPGKMTGTAAAGAGNAIELPKDDMAHLKEKIQEALKSMPDFRNLKDHVEMSITADGLRIEMLETEAGMFFESGRAAPTSNGTELLTRLAEELGKLPNGILIEGHTDSKPFASDGSYSNWELASDRANSARRIMQVHGIRPEQIAQVRGFADRHLRRPDDPGNASNRRISVIVQYLAPPPGAEAKEGGESKEGAAPKESKEHKEPGGSKESGGSKEQSGFHESKEPHK
jgi:chemotaxis protein MotB